MSEIADLKAMAVQNQKDLAVVTKSLNTLTERMSKTPAAVTANQVFGMPHVRYGEDPLSSRGFSFGKMLGLITGAVSENEAKTEMDIHRRLNKVYCEDMGNAGYTYAGAHQPGMPGGKFLAPLSTSYMQENFVPREFRREMKALVQAGCDGADYDEMKWIRTKQLTGAGYGRKDLSWLNELAGGALVAPPEMGELIELLRNKEALVNAGARTVPLPPQGRLKFPRQTSASLTFWIGENKRIDNSDIGTGEITLQAKKLAVLVKAPNELLRFASPAAEALIRDDMTKSLALGLDLAGLEGLGGDHRPLGIIPRPNIQRIDSSRPGANGDALVAEDIYRMVAAVEEANAEFEGWIMRPKTWFKYLQLRADAVANGDKQGMFLFNMIREPGEMAKPSLATYPVTKSTQVSQVRAKGSASNLTYILGGMFSDILIGMFGAIEFAATTLGDTPFQFDQTWIRGIVSADIQVRHEAALVFMDNLNTQL
jgi:HK97 family phage major capsid protein